MYIFFASKVIVFRIGLDNAPAWDHIIKDDLLKLEEFGEVSVHYPCSILGFFSLRILKVFSSTGETAYLSVISRNINVSI